MKYFNEWIWTLCLVCFCIYSFKFCITLCNYKNSICKEKNKFIAKFGTLNSERAAFAKSQSINKEILSNTSSI
jgi:heme exporter protein D